MKRVDRLAMKALGSAAAMIALLGAGPAFAQDSSPNAVTNLIRLLVEQKVISAEAGTALAAQAEAEAAAAQAKLAAPAAPPPPPPGAVRVPYVPQLVKDEIREELRKEVIAQAKTEGWAAPDTVPGWVNKVRISGDIRFRNQSAFYSHANANDIVDLEAFNADGPTDTSGNTSVNIFPILNTRTDRLNRLSVRARFNVQADVTPFITLGAGIASSNDDGPTSTTQLLGGSFGKKDVWLDLAYITLKPTSYATANLGRFKNPFLSNDILFDEDMNFDGAALSLNSARFLGKDFTLSATGGVFPFEYVGNNDPVSEQSKARGTGKWIFGGQVVANYDSDNGIGLTVSAGYYDFYKVRGRISEPCRISEGATDCTTDWTRPAYINKGNTLMYVRNIAFDPLVPFAPQPQFLGLVQDFNVLEANAEARFEVADDVRVTVGGLFLKNLAFKSSDACRFAPLGVPVTNVEETPVIVPGSSDPVGNTNPCVALTNSTPVVAGGPLLARYRSGSKAWMLRAAVGTKELSKSGEWSVSFAYKRIEPDAVLDSLSDSDFHLGGTNAKGYVVGGSYMLFDNLRMTSRWLSANEVYGRPLSINVLQMDLVAGF